MAYPRSPTSSPSDLLKSWGCSAKGQILSYSTLDLKPNTEHSHLGRPNHRACHTPSFEHHSAVTRGYELAYTATQKRVREKECLSN